MKASGQSFNQVYSLVPQQLQLGFLKVLRGSAMYDRAAEYGCIYKKKEPYEVLSTKWLSYEKVLKLKLVEEMVEVYYNSGQFSATLRKAEALFPEPFDMYEALGEFYERKGYLQGAHRRTPRVMKYCWNFSRSWEKRNRRMKLSCCMISIRGKI